MVLFKKKEDDDFMNYFYSFNVMINFLWCIIDDFNEFYSLGDKKRGRVVTFERIRYFNEFCLRIKFENIFVMGFFIRGGE